MSSPITAQDAVRIVALRNHSYTNERGADLVLVWMRRQIVASAMAGFTNVHVDRSAKGLDTVVASTLRHDGFTVRDGAERRAIEVSWGPQTVYRLTEGQLEELSCDLGPSPVAI